jgi:hypothetical protein
MMITAASQFSLFCALLPEALNVSFPFAYMQSSFITGHTNGISCRGTMANPTLSRADRLKHLRVYASQNTSFRGGGILINTMETTAALEDIREMNTLILQVATETGSPPFYGMWIPSRLPGLWWHDN